MKHLTALLLFLLCATSFALECACGQGALRLTWENDGLVRVFAKDATEPLLEIAPSLKGEVTAEVTPRGWLKYDILSLRTAESSIGIKVERNRPVFTISVCRNASPVEVRWNAQAVVLPDVLAEDIVLEAAGQERALPPFMPMYLGLLQGGNTMVTVMPGQTHQPAILSADLQTLTLNMQNNDDYGFLVTAAPGVWHQAFLPENEGDKITDESWNPPYPAQWKGAIPMEQDFLASGDGSHNCWGVTTIGTKPDGTTPAAFCMSNRCVMTNVGSRQTWLGGFEGNFHYPIEFQDGKLILQHPRFQIRDRVKCSTVKPVYFYAFQKSDKTPKEVIMPWDALLPWNQRYFFSNNHFAATPATCSITEQVEKIFYKGDSLNQQKEIHQQLLSMQFFVEGIRGRIENFRQWKEAILIDADRACRVDAALETEKAKLADILMDVDALYDAALPVIQTPDVVEEYSRQVWEIAKSEDDDDEKEDAAKELGRKIRTIGGGQDNLNAKFRHIAKNIRFQAIQNYMASTNPEVSAFWGNAYRETEPLLQGYFGHDGK